MLLHAWNELFVEEIRKEGQQQRIRPSRLENEAASGVRILFCISMLCNVRIIAPEIRCQPRPWMHVHFTMNLRAIGFAHLYVKFSA